jgi:hypothetical protein
MCDCRGYAYLPVLDDTALEAARAGRIRELAVRVATPRNLQTVAAYQRQMKQGMVDLMGPQIATQVEVKFSVRASDPISKSDGSPAPSIGFVTKGMPTEAQSRNSRLASSSTKMGIKKP